ncbi:hypothetical protein J2S70_001087 [Trueperella bonasi]|uniref:Uncharacterized protein n=1 Tax=Trueperella bonasi TaxID=312286 RepID=A0ABT9NH35_9ACTO|nr:hypothetical protein [Trueperella bonasi]MDP9806505.1 hypothetical protein [Trueperella bonasi]
MTLRAHLEFTDSKTADTAVTKFLDILIAENGFPGSGGWVARTLTPDPSATSRIIDFTAGGQDVADAISYAAEDAVAHFGTFEGTSVRWEQLPYADGSAGRR